MLLLVAPVLGVLVGRLLGGDLGNWQRIPFRWPWLVFVALLVRLAAGFTPIATIDVARYLYVAGLLGLLAWMLLQVRAVPALYLCAAGLVLNLVVIVANGAHMPVSGMTPPHGGTYIAAGPDTRLNWLGDWIALPGWLGGVLSPGDLVIAAGVGVAAFAITRFPESPSKLDDLQSGSEPGRE